jgi:4-hydroxy-3-polyprenylbenzoate decarboxylase
LVVGITGASGAVYGITILELLHRYGLAETHLVISRGGKWTIHDETSLSVSEVEALADHSYRDNDLGAAIASGSFPVDGMIIAPCSVKTLSGVANSYDENLVVRAADVTLKERRRLVLLLRETPLHAGHLRLMAQAAEAGAIIMPPVPAFYSNPSTIEDLVVHTVGRALDLFELRLPGLRRWGQEHPRDIHHASAEGNGARS